jgi:hypothetical protein
VFVGSGVGARGRNAAQACEPSVVKALADFDLLTIHFQKIFDRSLDRWRL